MTNKFIPQSTKFNADEWRSEESYTTYPKIVSRTDYNRRNLQVAHSDLIELFQSFEERIESLDNSLEGVYSFFQKETREKLFELEQKYFEAIWRVNEYGNLYSRVNAIEKDPRRFLHLNDDDNIELKNRINMLEIEQKTIRELIQASLKPHLGEVEKANKKYMECFDKVTLNIKEHPYPTTFPQFTEEQKSHIRKMVTKWKYQVTSKGYESNGALITEKLIEMICEPGKGDFEDDRLL